MARTTDGSARSGLSPFLLFSNIVIWCSAVIVMGIVSYFISQSTYAVGRLLIYTEVIAVLTVAFFVASFLLGKSPGYSLLFNIIFSYLWLVAVVFTAESWSHSGAGALAHTVEAFSFIAFFFLVFNIFHDWNLGFGAELLGLILGDESLQLKDVAALARTCTFYQIATSHLYRFNIKHERSSVLFWAVENSQLKTMRRALELGADPNTVGPDPGESPEELFNAATGNGRRRGYYTYGSPLHYAARAGDDQMLLPTILINRGAPMQMACEVEEVGYGPSLLHCASAHGLESLVRLALEKDPALLGRRAGDSPFDYTAQSWNSEGVIRCLVSAGADLDEENRDTHLTPIFRACEVGNFSTAMHLLRAGAQTAPAQPHGLVDFRRPPLLHYAVCSKDYDFDRPLPQAARDEQQLAFVRALIEVFGQNVNETFCFEDGMVRASPLAVAMFGDIEISWARVLCRGGEMYRRFENTLAGHVNPDVIKLLLSAGADPHHAGTSGHTPLALAVARLVNLYDEDEPVYHKEEGAAFSIVAMLLRSGARLDQTNVFGDTPLGVVAHIRAIEGHDTGVGQLFDFLLKCSSPENWSYEYLISIMRSMIGKLERQISREKREYQ
ncbi:hypothetical protein DL770_000702 [Monosporascus sp. CRB-9-2]|nr:hypothetical protein DL770_000702 [Monosporascus sp. CRB-9-2]